MKKQNFGIGTRVAQTNAGTLVRRLSSDNHTYADWEQSQLQVTALEIEAGLLDAPPSCQRVWFKFRLTHPRHQVVDALAILNCRGLTIQNLAELWKRHGAMSLVLRIRSRRCPASRSGVPDAEGISGAPGGLDASGPSSLRGRVAVGFAKGTFRRWSVQIRPAVQPAVLT